MKNVIKDIETWNEFYFYNCYYSALFPILQHYKKSIAPIMLDDIFYFEMAEKDGKEYLDYKRDRINDYDKIFEELGIVEKVYTYSGETIVDELKKSIDSNVPVMLFIDCFYQSMRSDAYNLNHWGHIVTVYGYDDEQEGFLVLEHRYEDGFDYDKRLFAYKDISACYQGFLELRKGNDFGGYIEFHHDENRRSEIYSAADDKKNFLVFADKMLEAKEKILKGINFLDGLIGKYSSEPVFDIRKTLLYDPLIIDYNCIVLKKTTEYQRLFKYLGDDHPLSLLAEEIYMKWTYIYGLAIKQGLSDERLDLYNNAILENLKQISVLEKSYIEEMYKVIEEWRLL
jgi:hypothetical protein